MIVSTPYGRDVEVGLDSRGKDLKHVSFAGRDLRDYDFRGADLRNADFTGCRITNCRFDDPDTDIRACDFSESVIVNGRFDGAQAQRTVWRGTSVQRARFDGTELDDADFSMSEAGVRTNMFGSNFTGAIVRRVLFIGANLRSVIAGSGTVVEDITTAGADLANCALTGPRDDLSLSA